MQWHQATSIEVRFRGPKGDQAQQGSVIVRKRDDASGTRSGVGGGGSAVDLIVVLLSVYPTMPESAPLSSYRCGNEVRVWRRIEAFVALRKVAARAGDDLIEVGLHSLRIGAAIMLAARGDVSQRVIQREGRWKSSESSKVYTRNNPEDAGIVSRYCISLTSRDWEDRAKAARSRDCMGPNTVVSTRPRSWGVVNGLLPLGVSVARDCVC